MDIPGAQVMASKASTQIDYTSNLDIYSKANRWYNVFLEKGSDLLYLV